MPLSLLGGVEFPLTVAFAGAGTRLFETEIDAAIALEWFDSSDQEGIRVTDAQGRGVELVIEALSIRVLRLLP